MEILLGAIAFILFLSLLFVIGWGYHKLKELEDPHRQAKLEKQYREKEEELNNLYKQKQEKIEEELSNKRKLKLQEIENEVKERYEKELKQFEKEKDFRINQIEETIKLYKTHMLEKFLEIQTRNDNRKGRLDEEFFEYQAEVEAEMEEIQDLIDELKRRQRATIEAYKRQEHEKHKDTFYRIVLSELEQEELAELNKAVRKLSNPQPFYKAIYDIYYKNKVNDLVNRVVGTNKVSGIYKITHIESGKTYVGQSVNIGNRWKQHAKRGCGADTITNNKLYPEMMKYGLESFSFEVLESIPNADKEQLNKAEQYWQDYFMSKDFGYSMK